MRSTRITIVEGGERLYVHPFVRHINPTTNRAFYFLNQLPPFYNGLATMSNDSTKGYMKEFFETRRQRLRWWWMMGPGRLMHMLGRVFTDDMDRMFTWHQWRRRHLVVPFLAWDYPKIQLSLPNQLMVVDPDEMVDEIYLTPRTAWITKRLEEHEPKYYHQQQALAAYKAWRQKWIDRKDFEIDFLCEIDT